MIAAKIFNDRENNRVNRIYGAVTTGNHWKFLKYENDAVYIDRLEYYIDNVKKIIGILVKMVNLEA